MAGIERGKCRTRAGYGARALVYTARVFREPCNLCLAGGRQAGKGGRDKGDGERRSVNVHAYDVRQVSIELWIDLGKKPSVAFPFPQ